MLPFDTLNINLGLTRVKKVLAELGDPHLKFKSIHVAGTNGKGSVCAMLDSILREAGYKVGLFTSPHLFRWSERIKVNGKEINNLELRTLNFELKKISKKLKIELTPFEIITCIAFKYFAEQKVDIAVVEVGMGGRLDATNVLIPLVSVITNIDYDHTEYLGKTIKKIAFEKAGIIKHGVPVVTAEKKTEALSIIKKTAHNKKARLSIVGNKVIIDARSPLIGPHQRINEAIATKVAELLDIKKSAINKGLKKTSWPGRFQIVQKKPMVIVDGAHNVAGAKALIAAIKEQKIKKPITFILGFQGYKDIDGILQIIYPHADKIILTKSSHPQAADYPTNIRQAIKKAKEFNQTMIIAGSLFVAAEALKIIDAGDSGW